MVVNQEEGLRGRNKKQKLDLIKLPNAVALLAVGSLLSFGFSYSLPTNNTIDTVSYKLQ
jgi:hypothetical protein